ncbi:hypothetical protein COT66_00240 [Candidatus Shapirobacteria bacterium CG09_land_8_20_14_0_10_49_15]|uniref:UPF0251 protein COU97_00320 n=2 Tax=Candidatus Shapironibacteriota TaxID=1752721 RepID=A0A2M8L7T8_9BACT|nr:MAG: hypothetical protein COT66_00240 [Candidatus Shapirobacteria bacterium CG09_land_8_20_14_0_10_49_15]PJE70303.1 MAG: hypothetical protein COU97_00320 [Candidatus Shapirobacteria bacterium CG10_big_fil_rev_8_21_14_0_10_48_15]
MPRPKKPRRLRFRPEVCYYKPRGIPLRLLEEVVLLPEEMEAIKLHEVDGLDQVAAAQKMAVSQSTFQRILAAAYHKIGEALVNGKAIRLEYNKTNG